MAIELTPAGDDDEGADEYDTVVISAELHGSRYRLGSMVFDPMTLTPYQVQLGLAKYMRTVADAIEFAAQAHQELAGLLGEDVDYGLDDQDD